MSAMLRTITMSVLWMLTCGCTLAVNLVAFQPQKGRDVEFDERWGERVLLETEDRVNIESFLFTCQEADRFIVYFHGNAGHAGHRFDDARRLAQCGANVLLVSYRGYGNSEGSPSEAGVYRDGRAALEHLTIELGVPSERIVLLGRSLGSAVAVDVAADFDVGGVLLISPMSTGRDLASHFGFGWLSWMVGDQFDNLSKIDQVTAPIQVIHGDRDRIVPLWMGEKVAQAAGERARLRVLSGVGHNDMSRAESAPYWETIIGFLEECVPPTAEARGGAHEEMFDDP